MQIGTYQLGETLGLGGAAQVWRAMRVDVGDPVAVKVLTSPNSRTSRYRRYFDNEIAAVARLAHPAIVQVLDVGVVPEGEYEGNIVEGAPFLAMELVEGPTLAAPDLLLGWPEIEDILDGLLQALSHAHARGVLHLDLKPANVLLRPLGRGYAPLLTDFGIARVEDAMHGTESTRVVGTPMHMSPEQVLGRWRDYVPATDLYGVGSVAWTILTGEAPFSEESTYHLLKLKTYSDPGTFRPTVQVPLGLEEWIRKLMARRPEDRYPSATAARRALAQISDPSRKFVGFPSDWRGGDPQQRTDPSATLIGLRVPAYVGRTRERDILWRELRAATHEGVRFVVVSGESGIGKTRLAEWVCQRATELDVATPLIATHGIVRTPLDGLGGLLARHFRTTSLSTEETTSRIIDQLAPGGSHDQGLILDAVSLADIALPPRVDGKPGTASVETSRVVGRYLSRLAGRKPVVLVLDDAQWGTDSLAVVESLRDVHPDAAILVIATVRTGVDDALDVPQHRAIQLDPMSPEESADLIRQVFPATPDLVEQLIDDTDGVPAVIIETIADLVDRGSVRRTTAGWQLVDNTRPTRNNLASLWRRRIEFAVGGEDRQWMALEAAAALGPKFDGEQWRAVCSELEVPLTSTLAERLVRFRIVRLDVPEDHHFDAYAFAHDIVRQTILENADTEGRRRAIERSCARVLEQLFAGTKDAGILSRIANHLEVAGEFDEATDWFERAIAAHEARGEHGQARLLADRLEALRTDENPRETMPS